MTPTPRLSNERREEIDALLEHYEPPIRMALRDCLHEIDRLEKELGDEYSADADIQKQISLMQADLDRREELIERLSDLADKMQGFVKSYGLSDTVEAISRNSEWDRWKDCKEQLAIARREAEEVSRG